MRIEHLWELLEKEEIYLNYNYESDWEDKNDVELIKIYKDINNIEKLGVSCLTTGRDRYHFWKIYGGEREGVCLWFDKVDLMKDIKKDKKLLWNKVDCYNENEFKEKRTIPKLPFIKRKQYEDEKEFRVFREHKRGDTSEAKGIKFTPKSLKRIYLNSWLDQNPYAAVKSKINEKLRGRYEVELIQQSKILEYPKWINIAKELK